MTVAQGIKKSTSIGLQVALGTPNVTAGQILRRRTAIFKSDRDMFTSDEIVSHHQSTGAEYGVKKVSGHLDGLLSPLTYQLPIEGLLEAVFATGGTITATTIAASGSGTFTDSGSGFLTAGFKVGDVVRASGFTGSSTNSNGRNMLLTAVVAGTLTFVLLDGGAATIADAAGESVTIAVVGKKCKPPLTGHTNSYYTVEEFYSDITKSELFADCKVSQIAVSLPATGNAGIALDFIGLSRTLASGSAQVASRAAETTTGLLASINGLIYANGSLVGNVTGVSLNISNSAAAVGAVIGSNSSPDVAKGRIQVTGSFTGLFDGTTLQALFDAETKISLVVVITDDNTSTSAFMVFTVGRLALTGDAPDDGEKGIMRTYPFTAELNANGGAALAWDETIITVQDSNAA